MDNNTNNNVQQEQASALQLMDLVGLSIRHWKWFVLSVFVCVSVAAAYLSTKSPVYSRKASILIKEQGKGSSLFSSELNNFAEMGMFSTTTNVNNELVAFQSPDLLLEVVRRLDLDMNYEVKVPKRLRTQVIYGYSLPVKVEFKDLSYNQGAAFKLTLGADSTFTLSTFRRGDQEFKEAEPVTARCGEEVDTPAGKVMVTYSPFFTPETQEGMEILVTRSGLMGAMRSCKSRLTATLNSKQSTIIDLTYLDLNTQRAEDFLNTLISAYNENWVKDKNQIAVSTSQFIDERLKVIERELGAVDKDISSYKSENLIPDVQGVSQMAMQQATNASMQINNLNNQLYMARYLKDQISSQGRQFHLLPANSGVSGGGLDNLIGNYNAKVLQRNNLVANSSPENPLVLDLDRELMALQSAILQSVDNTINDLNTQIASLRAVETASTTRLSSNPKQAEYLLSVERQQTVKESLYLFLLQKREENELSQAFTAYNTRTVISPTGGNSPVAPKKMQILLVALMIGLMIPVIILYLKETLNTTVRGRKDVEKQLSLPFIGEIPQHEPRPKTFWGKIMPRKWFLKRQKTDSRTILVKPGSRSVMNEAFRVVRTNIEFMENTTKGPRIIMFTSMNPGSGKTFLTMNIATSFAIKGKKVIALDLDLRRASLSEYVESPKQGLSEYLNGTLKDWTALKVPVEGVENLEVLPVGTIPPNPAELLFSPRLQPLMDQLSTRYDMIFLDCPPVEIVADASVIAQYANLTVFVVRANLMERELLPEIERYYKARKFNSMCVLLNGTTGGGGRYGYHRYGYGHYGHYGHYGSYGYGYGSYGYGYGSKDASKDEDE